MAKLYFHYAAMDAGKTTMLLQAAYNYRERGMTTMLFVAGHYRKSDRGYISSRIGLEAEAAMFREGDDLFARVAEHHDHTSVHAVFVDEAQFLENEQVWQLGRVADRLGIPVLCYGLRTDFQGNLFSGSRALLAIADDAVIVADAAHRIVLFNEGAERAFGHAAADVIGRPLSLLLPDARLVSRYVRHHGADVATLFGRGQQGAEIEQCDGVPAAAPAPAADGQRRSQPAWHAEAAARPAPDDAPAHARAVPRPASLTP